MKKEKKKNVNKENKLDVTISFAFPLGKAEGGRVVFWTTVRDTCTSYLCFAILLWFGVADWSLQYNTIGSLFVIQSKASRIRATWLPLLCFGLHMILYFLFFGNWAPVCLPFLAMFFDASEGHSKKKKRRIVTISLRESSVVEVKSTLKENQSPLTSWTPDTPLTFNLTSPGSCQAPK
jgi:hypothetical protein